MKLSYLALCAVLAFSATISCAKKDAATAVAAASAPDPTAPVVGTAPVILNKTATSFSVIWGEATDDSTEAEDLLYRLVYSTSNNLTTAEDALANGTVVVDWTANALLGNLSSLTHSTTYYLAVLVKDEDESISLSGTSTTTLCTGKKMFLATVPDGNFGGKAGGDAACVAQRPGGTGTYKAVLADTTGINSTTGFPSGTGRQACHGNCEATTLYTEDWTLAANRTYCTADFASRVGTTGTYPVLYVPVANILSATPTVLFTGFNIAWGDSHGSTCNNWTANSGTFVGGIANGLYTGQSGDRSFIANFPFPDCSSAGAVICAEQ